MVMSIGWNPYFNNTEKTIVSSLIYNKKLKSENFFFSYIYIGAREPLKFYLMVINYIYVVIQEPWLLHDFDEDFYGEELSLVIVGYIRAEVFLKKRPCFYFNQLLIVLFC